MSQQINLYHKSPSVSLPMYVALGAIGLVILGLAAWVVINEVRISSSESKRRELTSALEGIQKQTSERRLALGLPDVEAQQREIAELRTKINSNRDLLVQLDRGEFGTRSGHSRVFEAVALASQKGLWLTGVEITKSGQSLAVSGRAYDSEAVMRYSRRLNEMLKSRAIEFQFSGLDMTKGSLVSGQSRDAKAVPVDGIRFTLN